MRHPQNIDYPRVRPSCLRDMVIQSLGIAAGKEGKPLSACPYRKHQRRYCWEHGWKIGRKQRRADSAGEGQ